MNFIGYIYLKKKMNETKIYNIGQKELGHPVYQTIFVLN